MPRSPQLAQVTTPTTAHLRFLSSLSAPAHADALPIVSPCPLPILSLRATVWSSGLAALSLSLSPTLFQVRPLHVAHSPHKRSRPILAVRCLCRSPRCSSSRCSSSRCSSARCSSSRCSSARCSSARCSSARCSSSRALLLFALLLFALLLFPRAAPLRAAPLRAAPLPARCSSSRSSSPRSAIRHALLVLALTDAFARPFRAPVVFARSAAPSSRSPSPRAARPRRPRSRTMAAAAAAVQAGSAAAAPTDEDVDVAVWPDFASLYEAVTNQLSFLVAVVDDDSTARAIVASMETYDVENNTASLEGLVATWTTQAAADVAYFHLLAARVWSAPDDVLHTYADAILGIVIPPSGSTMASSNALAALRAALAARILLRCRKSGGASAIAASRANAIAASLTEWVAVVKTSVAVPPTSVNQAMLSLAFELLTWSRRAAAAPATPLVWDPMELSTVLGAFADQVADSYASPALAVFSVFLAAIKHEALAESDGLEILKRLKRYTSDCIQRHPQLSAHFDSRMCNLLANLCFDRLASWSSLKGFVVQSNSLGSAKEVVYKYENRQDREAGLACILALRSVGAIIHGWLDPEFKKLEDDGAFVNCVCRVVVTGQVDGMNRVQPSDAAVKLLRDILQGRRHEAKLHRNRGLQIAVCALLTLLEECPDHFLHAQSGEHLRIVHSYLSQAAPQKAPAGPSRAQLLDWELQWAKTCGRTGVTLQSEHLAETDANTERVMASLRDPASLEHRLTFDCSERLANRPHPVASSSSPSSSSSSPPPPPPPDPDDSSLRDDMIAMGFMPNVAEVFWHVLQRIQRIDPSSPPSLRHMALSSASHWIRQCLQSYGIVPRPALAVSLVQERLFNIATTGDTRSAASTLDAYAADHPANSANVLAALAVFSTWWASTAVPTLPPPRLVELTIDAVAALARLVARPDLTRLHGRLLAWATDVLVAAIGLALSGGVDAAARLLDRGVDVADLAENAHIASEKGVALAVAFLIKACDNDDDDDGIGGGGGGGGGGGDTTVVIPADLVPPAPPTLVEYRDDPLGALSRLLQSRLPWIRLLNVALLDAYPATMDNGTWAIVLVTRAARTRSSDQFHFDRLDHVLLEGALRVPVVHVHQPDPTDHSSSGAEVEPRNSGGNVAASPILKEALQLHGPALLRNYGACAVTASPWRLRGGARETEDCLVVYVRAKGLYAFGEARVPATVMVAQAHVPVDVRQGWTWQHMGSGVDEANERCDQLCIGAGFRSQNGVDIKAGVPSPSYVFATMGALVETNDARRLRGLLTAGHAVECWNVTRMPLEHPAKLDPDADWLEPILPRAGRRKLMDGDGVSASVVVTAPLLHHDAHFYADRNLETADAAFCPLLPREHKWVPGFAAAEKVASRFANSKRPVPIFTGAAIPRGADVAGRAVFKVGIATGLTVETIDVYSHHLKFMDVPAYVYDPRVAVEKQAARFYHKQLVVRKPRESRFSAESDSGSLVLTVDGLAIGMVIGGLDVAATDPERVSVITPIWAILDRLNVSFVRPDSI